MTERDFQAQVLQLASAAGWMAYHTHDSRHSAAGYPDLCLCRGDRLIYAEMKVGRGTTSEAQREWLDRLSGVEGVECVVWRPDEPPAAERWTGIIETPEAIGRRLGR